MKTLLLSILLLPAALFGQQVQQPLPNAPLGQVHDRSQWLGEERTQLLEDKLQRYRQEHGVDVLVVVWDHALPAESSLHDLATQLGAQWTRSELWAVVLTEANPVGRPEIRYGGAVADAIDPESLDRTVSEVVTRGLKDWTDQSRVEAIAMGIAREFIYLAQRREQELAVVREQAAVIVEERTKVRKRGLAGFVLKGILAVAALAGGAIAWTSFRRQRPFEFPETRWRRRLGGEWSGGSTIMVKSSSTPPS